MLNYQYHNSAFSVYIVYQFINNKYIWLILPIKWTTVHTFMCLARGVQSEIGRCSLFPSWSG
jgi:hypothetical protein